MPKDTEHGIQSGSESGGGGRIRLVVIGYDDDTYGVGDFARLIVRHLYGLRDGIHHVQRFVQMFVKLFGVLKRRVELDLTFAGGSVDEVLDGAEFGGFGVECHECGVGVFHDIPSLHHVVVILFLGLYLKSFISHAVIIFNFGVSFLYVLRGSILAAPRKSHTCKKSPHSWKLFAKKYE